MSRFSRGEHKRRKGEHGPGQQSVSGLTPIDVRVSADGSATVGGLPVVVGPGESVQDAVLNYLHRLVLATGHRVAATVHDERIGFSTPIQVAADGSSRFAGEPVRFAVPASVPAPAGANAAEAAGASLRQAPEALVSAVPPQPRPQPHSDRATRALRAVPDPTPGEVSEPTPAPPAAGEPAPVPTPVAATAPTAAGATVPSLLAEPVRRINDAVQMGRIESAAAMAEQSIASASQTLGAEHPEVLQLRELAAYIAYLAGDAQRSFALSMELARVRRRQKDARAHVNVQSAAAAWRAVGDPSQGLALGRELIGLWSELAVDGGPAAADTRQLDAARARMDRLAERARALAENPYAQRPHAHGQ
jgi:hypothetical protein